MAWSLRPATPAYAEWLADLNAVAMRPDLERAPRAHPTRLGLS